ncbi:MAG: hypothetical protein PHG29_13745 [Prolixibacteraceae bacterium]|nr:hypothetical protein [Prolixibacteraceae bacterium]
MLKIDISIKNEGLSSCLSALKDLTDAYGDWSDDIRDLARAQARKYSQGGGFWESIARSVKSGYNADGGHVWSDHFAGRHKDLGGAIEARRKPWLTIPIHQISRARTYAALKADGYKMFRPGPKDAKRRVLGYRDATGHFVALFALCRRTRPQRAFPWWPKEEEALAIGREIVKEHIS